MTNPFGFCHDSVLHFIGIGGIGMSALALVAHDWGYSVQGSDACVSPIVQTLRGRGIPVALGHDADNVQNADVVVYSNAIRNDNIELRSAISAGKHVLRRIELLSKVLGTKRTVIVSGSHGKTTTTGMIASIMEHAAMDPTIFIGGIALSYGSNYKVGTGEWAVVEGDESDASFTTIPCEIAVVTNLEWEHPDRYRCFEELEEVFSDFLHNVKVGGAAIIPSGLSPALDKGVSCDKVVHGLYSGDFLATNVAYVGGTTVFDVVGSSGAKFCCDVKLPVPGRHNVENALAAVAATRQLGIDFGVIKSGLENFMGVGRRFEIIANVRGVTFIDDYAHHPTEIEATKDAAALFAEGRVIGVLQPHRFTRVKHCFAGFVRAISKFDYMVLTDAYSAGEETIAGCGSPDIICAVKSLGFDQVVHASDPGAIADIIGTIAKPGDVVVAMGAGSITSIIRSVVDAYTTCSA
ncbi:UDP-N-acetylmuramate--L-alanine ligase [Anaplasma capra]|uniref:UDP-N-acetylmuramate--L-alanine ligase n=1 Tax=Anaplasma capra TaxID=1562740 RepID=UPI0021D5B657|nr:UDP-N-acetylmuramate--L-alanine ligase [Anaplasma capra]MCU7612613.1 UDP-N-acetylmuramate--L-alanine ligase [Anaplasma capra]